jgi:hypothetical protein
MRVDGVAGRVYVVATLGVYRGVSVGVYVRVCVGVYVGASVGVYVVATLGVYVVAAVGVYVVATLGVYRGVNVGAYVGVSVGVSADVYVGDNVGGMMTDCRGSMSGGFGETSTSCEIPSIATRAAATQTTMMRRMEFSLTPKRLDHCQPSRSISCGPDIRNVGPFWPTVK